LKTANTLEGHINNWEQWQQRCARVLRENLLPQAILDRLPYRYTSPAAENGTYLPQWLWDSCFHALTYRWLDPRMAWDELRSLLVHQVTAGAEAGMVPHMAYFAENEATACQTLFRHSDRSFLTQPPLIALAAWAVYQIDPNKAVLAEIYEQVKKYHSWFDRRRDPDDDHLVAIIHPWESGWDASQRWDHALGFSKTETGSSRVLGEKRLSLVDVIHTHSCNAAELSTAAHGFYVKPVDFNAIRAADLSALAQIAHELGEAADAQVYTQKVTAIQTAIQEKMVTVKGDRIFAYDLIGADGLRSSIDSAAKFVLLFGKCVDQNQAQLLKSEIEGETGSFTTPNRIVTTPPDTPGFDPAEYWRGNVWLPINWLIYTGLKNYQFTSAARNLATESLNLVASAGFCEFFNAETGTAGQKNGQPCPQNQSWSTIVLDMLGNLV